MIKQSFLSLIILLSIIISFQSCKPEEISDPIDYTKDKLTLNISKCTLEIKDKKTLKATLTSDDDPTVTWESNDNEVATVNDNGVVKAISEGRATITAQVGEIKATCKVTVIAKLETFDLTPQDTLFIRTGDKGNIHIGKIMTTIKPEDFIQYLDISIEPEDMADISVNNDGNIVVDAKRKGEATITAKIKDKSKSVIVKLIDDSEWLGNTVCETKLTQYAPYYKSIGYNLYRTELGISKWKLETGKTWNNIIEITSNVDDVNTIASISIKDKAKNFIYCSKEYTRFLQILGSDTITCENIDCLIDAESRSLTIEAAFWNSYLFFIDAPNTILCKTKALEVKSGANIKARSAILGDKLKITSGTLTLYNAISDSKGRTIKGPAITFKDRPIFEITEFSDKYEGESPSSFQKVVYLTYTKLADGTYATKPYIRIVCDKQN